MFVLTLYDSYSRTQQTSTISGFSKDPLLHTILNLGLTSVTRIDPLKKQIIYDSPYTHRVHLHLIRNNLHNFGDNRLKICSLPCCCCRQQSKINDSRVVLWNCFRNRGMKLRGMNSAMKPYTNRATMNTMAEWHTILLNECFV